MRTLVIWSSKAPCLIDNPQNLHIYTETKIDSKSTCFLSCFVVKKAGVLVDQPLKGSAGKNGHNDNRIS